MGPKLQNGNNYENFVNLVPKVIDDRTETEKSIFLLSTFRVVHHFGKLLITYA